MDANLKLHALEGEILDDPTLYRKLINTIFQPDITFAVTKLAQFMADPRTPHLTAVHQVLCYLKAALGQCILFLAANKFNLSVYADADWGSCLDTRRSTTGYYTFFGDSLITWKSNEQSVVSRSSIEAEYKAIANASCEII
ncbi:uncharacterized protein LOC107647050 [Arachis ipaensis]|uniref:uncharacterized protein LOC107647050 n=1 Tax=Arachis ipaensis TaxID=130454 RepID=UPI0007AFC39E|nr:uncharacterized protein LOC107647050 [Arachis ipaensis]XP_025661657.1 uncharacterized protein LOC112757274 [Arachis hypogaea]